MSRTINLGRVTGKSAYEIWLDLGNIGTEQDFINSLQGQQGIPGKDGANGTNGKDGKDGKDGTNGTNGVNGQDGYTPVRGTDYWTNQDIAVIEQYCANYIDANINQAIGGSY